MFLKQLWKYINIFDSIFSTNSTSLESIELDLNVILIVGMADSSYFVKWLTTMEQELSERRIIVYPSDRPRFMHTQHPLYKKNLNKKLKVFRLLPQTK